jgi:septal ring factor EnvC (AmiA/AmiB activator)
MKCHLLFAIVLLLSASLPLYAQQETLGSIYTSLDELERTLLDIQSENENLKADTKALRENLTESEAAGGRLLALSEELKRRSAEQEQAYKRLSATSEQSERRLRGWRLASIIEGAAIIGILAVTIGAR